MRAVVYYTIILASRIGQLGSVQSRWDCELKDVRREFRISQLEELAAIERKHKQLDCIPQSLDATRETTRSSGQTSQVMA
jgi:hypothetical protein